MNEANHHCKLCASPGGPIATCGYGTMSTVRIHDGVAGGSSMILAEKIIYQRRKAGLSQEQLADRLGITRQAVSKWESGVSHS